ncbi:hypothetical protein CSI37_02510 [Listeria monocytogenes]|uniref:hypothetical protein n=1 Tax=Listeria monocytogenes TaxID=1639 RepID=UPI00077A9D24|nr:hypothetical protein [Listeria monocytogenes]EAD3235679.1 hypothetical protein [Listeria monocytogenes CFSAN002202]EAF4520988.1 hypothetical protein [Listeria monocytogenes serotype 4b]EAG9423970.1 hypothetical protein [Listeria monocytogenes CFSAN002184]EAG9458520.1 hypothetical protein [Listeria monocytogenes CFSAN002208]ECT1641440.1 hypothetical protein [Listeria monocytogenes CFSAN002191]EHC5246846.1 hypothetical protein [Listeria monocytogenes serotype 1/2a]
MSGKIKFNIAEAQNISLELKIAVGRYTQETEELLKVLKNNSLCDKDQDVVELRGRVEKNNQRLIEYEKFVNTNIAKSSSVIEELFMSVEVLYAQQVSEFRNPNSTGYKELMGNVKAVAYKNLSNLPGLGGILTSESVTDTAKDLRDTLIDTLVDNTYMKLINDTVEYQGENKNIIELYGNQASTKRLTTKMPVNPTKYLSTAYLISDTLKSFNSYGNSKDSSRLAGDLTGIAIKKGADFAVGKLATTALSGFGVSGVKGAIAGAVISVAADKIIDPTVEYVKKRKIEAKREEWERNGISKGWMKIQDLKLEYTVGNYQAS